MRIRDRETSPISWFALPSVLASVVERLLSFVDFVLEGLEALLHALVVLLVAVAHGFLVGERFLGGGEAHLGLGDCVARALGGGLGLRRGGGGGGGAGGAALPGDDLHAVLDGRAFLERGHALVEVARLALCVDALHRGGERGARRDGRGEEGGEEKRDLVHGCFLLIVVRP